MAPKKILTQRALLRRLAEHRRRGQRIVFTNGCFDLIHAGHVRCLRAAKRLGSVLVVAVNTDASVRRLGKGKDRPVNPEGDRTEVVAALEMVDYVTLFAEETPLELIRTVRPDVLVKGGDWAAGDIVGADLMRGWGGKVKVIPYAQGYSTTSLLRRIRR